MAADNVNPVPPAVADWTPIITGIHASGWQGVCAVTGGGASALSELLSLPGGSRSLLAGFVPYHPAACSTWLGFPPEQYCSASTALAMGVRSFEHARSYVPEADVTRLFGIAGTASLVSDRPKRGDHRCYIACQTATESIVRSLTLQKGARSRPEEERVVREVILSLLGQTCGVDPSIPCDLLEGETVHEERWSPPEPLREVWLGRRPYAWSRGGEVLPELPTRPRALLCGSFNPFHIGHQELLAVAARKLGVSVGCELSLVNVDKPALDYLSIQARLQPLQQTPVVLTRAARFYEKCELLPDTWFVVGADTAARIVDPQYYGGPHQPDLSTALQRIRASGCRFLVAGRVSGNQFLPLDQLPIPTEFRDLFVGIPEAEFRRDLTSTELRRAAEQTDLDGN